MGSLWIRSLTGGVCCPCALLSQPRRDAVGSGVPYGAGEKGSWKPEVLKHSAAGSKGASSLD